MLTGRYGLGVAVVADRLYAIGGSGYEAGRANERYTPVGYNPTTPNAESFPIIGVVTAIVIIAVVGTSVLVYLAKIKKTPAKIEKIAPEGAA